MEGVEAIRIEIARAFGEVNPVEHQDPNTFDTVLGFAADGRRFVVRVSTEFDQDFASGQLTVDLTQLRAILFRSPNGTVAVRTTGIVVV